VAGGSRPPGTDRGGEGIQALRTRPALTWGLAAGLVATPLALIPAVSDPPLLAVGGAAIFVLAVGLVLGRPFAVPWAVAGLGAEYAVSLGDGGLDRRVPLYAVALLVTAELSYWSLQLRGAAPDEPGITQRRLIGLMLAATVALLVGTVLVAFANVPVGGGLAIEGIGIVAAIGALVLLLGASRATSEP
jgi:hypothetical protein